MNPEGRRVELCEENKGETWLREIGEVILVKKEKSISTSNRDTSDQERSKQKGQNIDLISATEGCK